MLVEKTFDTGEVILNYAEGEPNGPPLLLLHGAASVWESWEPILPHFSSNWHIYAPDFRGCGKSGHVSRGYRVEDFTRDIVAFIRTQIGEAVVIMGHSLGSAVATQLAAEYPALVRAVILEDPPFYLNKQLEEWLLYPFLLYAIEVSSSGLPAETIARQLQERFSMDPTLAESAARNLVRWDPDVGIQIQDKTMLERWQADSLLDRIQCPVLFLHGEWALGGVSKPEDVERAAALLQNGTVRGFTGVGHYLHRDATDEFTRLVTEFLATL